METNTSSILQKAILEKDVKSKTASTGCCGGDPIDNHNACCKLDEEKKATGEAGCGCSAAKSRVESIRCC